MFRTVTTSVAALILVIPMLAASAPSTAQPAKHDSAPPKNLERLAARMADCKEFRNACQVCARRADGKLGCSNVGIACNPSGEWRCSVHSQSAPTK